MEGSVRFPESYPVLLRIRLINLNILLLYNLYYVK